MRKAIIATIVASALFAVGAFAANMTVNADDVASGQASVGACGSAEVVAYTTEDNVVIDAIDSSSADFRIATATVRLTGVNCEGAAVDLAIGVDTSPTVDGEGNPVYTEADGWEDAACEADYTIVDGSAGTQFDYACSYVEGTGPLAGPTVEVAVLANGNALPTS